MIKQAACIGGGVIGGGWIARFILNGWGVNVYDSQPGAQDKVEQVLANARRSLPALADVPMPKEGKLCYCDSIEQAVTGASWIQESVPERLALKHSVFKELQRYCKSDAIIGSSTSGFTPTQLQQNSDKPEQIFVAHPFNPVYLLPLVEVVASAKNIHSRQLRAQEILKSIGMSPLLVRREIDAHIADRLLEAVWREALWLIKDDVATTAEIDDAIRFGFGLRWAQMGLFETYRIAGGEAGMAHFIAQFGPALQWPWTKLMDVPELTDELIEKIATQSDEQSGAYSIRELERIRDDNLVGIMRVQKNYNWGVGKMLKEQDQKMLADIETDSRTQSHQQPLNMYEGRVLPAWIDYNGHMNESHYLTVLSNATDNFMAYIGVDEQYIAQGGSYFTVETHIRHLDEAKLNAPLTVTTQLLSCDAKRMHLFHRLTCPETGKLLATGEHMLLHMDLNCGKTSFASDAVQSCLNDIFEYHSTLEKPEGAGSAIGVKLKAKS